MIIYASKYLKCCKIALPYQTHILDVTNKKSIIKQIYLIKGYGRLFSELLCKNWTFLKVFTFNPFYSDPLTKLFRFLRLLLLWGLRIGKKWEGKSANIMDWKP